MTVYSLYVLLSQFGTSPLFHIHFYYFLNCIQVFQETGQWSGIPNSLRNFQFVVMHTVKGLCIVNEAEVDAFLEFSCFLYDLMTFGYLISGSFVFSKSSLYIWKFSIQVLLKPSLKDFEHYLAGIWNEHNYAVVWTFFGIALLWIGMKTDLFQSCGHCWVFWICWHIECSTITISVFKILNSPDGMLLPPLALSIVMVPIAYLTSHSRISGSSWVTTPSWLSGSLRPFLYSSSVVYSPPGKPLASVLLLFI